MCDLRWKYIAELTFEMYSKKFLKKKVHIFHLDAMELLIILVYLLQNGSDYFFLLKVQSACPVKISLLMQCVVRVSIIYEYYLVRGAVCFSIGNNVSV